MNLELDTITLEWLIRLTRRKIDRRGGMSLPSRTYEILIERGLIEGEQTLCFATDRGVSEAVRRVGWEEINNVHKTNKGTKRVARANPQRLR